MKANPPRKPKGKRSTPRKLSDEALARAKVLVKQGNMTWVANMLRKEGLADVTPQAIGQRFRRLDNAPVRRRRLDHRTPAPERQEGAARREEPAPDVAALGEGLDDAPHELLARRLVQIRDFTERMHAAGNITAYSALVKLETDVSARLEAMRPPPVLDPADDPANAHARDEVRRMLEGLVVAAEASS